MHIELYSANILDLSLMTFYVKFELGTRVNWLEIKCGNLILNFKVEYISFNAKCLQMDDSAVFPSHFVNQKRHLNFWIKWMIAFQFVEV